ncbi:aldehyde dehydrogenase (NADP(+)) [Nocardia yamanashiensis]|uniref:aldehyde dehydrogenase (NADP(+)) n=1 Tax=Nocardia yamanashiensis TaxID=209247 RepID=UPI00083772FA|nr:aldehyde dehydrogenase (NADP(+)) [Nocardia yamanashiensis]
MIETTAEPIADTTAEAVDAMVAAAAAAAPAWAELGAAGRAEVLDGIADRLDAQATELIALARHETRLPEPRLTGELRRTTFQLRLFADTVRDGGYLDVRIDTADDRWPMGAPRPDLRRMNIPLGPVVNFAASNFPFAFSVPGGDTAAALAAGCPVIVKANPGHPGLSRAVGTIITAVMDENRVPRGTFGLVFGVDAGVRVLTHPAVAAAAFTGSIRGGRALFDIANARPNPIPFYGELGSVNPVFVTAAAAHSRPAEIAAGLLTTLSASAGQLCTKPGLIAVPDGSPLLEELAGTTPEPTGDLLNDSIEAGFIGAVEQIRAHPAVRILSGGASGRTLLLTTRAQDVLADPEALTQEMFGPAALVVTYRDVDELFALARAVSGQLTVSVFGDDTDDIARTLLTRGVDVAGRVLWNSWPTGLSVTYAQQHGGPYPATTAPTATSVGSASIARFLRPVVYQSVPAELLPPELRDDNPLAVPRSVNGARAR